MTSKNLYQLSAFTELPSGGNPAGVWVGDSLPSQEEMLRIAGEVGFSETAFVAPLSGKERTVRYFSPEAEVSFCGHATIATGVLLGKQNGVGRYHLQTSVGEVPVDVRRDGEHFVAALTSVDPRHTPAEDALLDDALTALRWRRDELDPTLPVAKAYAGAWHLVIAAGSRERLNDLDYDFPALKALMLANDLTTLQLIWRESDELIHARNPFPVGGVVEDPATGAAAAALGGYLRDSGLLAAPAQFQIRQGERMGRPSLLTVNVPREGGIVVSGKAVDL